MSAPLVSIVVPTLNQAQYIEQTLASIFGQPYPRLEVIVIDGGSTDGTHAIVARYPVAHFISEKDGGQSEAINKGFRLAKGEILAWLNSDDYYLPLTVPRAVAQLGEPTRPQLVYGNVLLWYEAEQRAVVERSRPFDRAALGHSCYLIQPSAFWTRALWERTGELNEQLHFTMDWDFWLRASEQGELRYWDETLSVYRFHAGHKSSSGSPKRRREILNIVEKHGAPEWAAAFRAVEPHVPAMATSQLHLLGRELHLPFLRQPGLLWRHGGKARAAYWQLRG